MKCKSHPYEQGVGVCASCLRERLLVLVAAQSELPVHHYHHHHLRWRSDPLPPPPPLVFPRSVSPYVFHRGSLGSDASPAHPHDDHHHRQRFFSTPQIGPTFAAAVRDRGFDEIDRGRRRRFSLFKILFGHHRPEEPGLKFGDSEASASGSWFSALIRGRRKKDKRADLSSTLEEPQPPGRVRKSHRTVVRGMSPDTEENDDDDKDSEISRDEWRRPTPTPIRRFPGNHRQHRSFGTGAGFSVCLSPLVRYTPNTRRNQASEWGVTGDLRTPSNSIHHPHRAGGGAALEPNRSRKLTELENSAHHALRGQKSVQLASHPKLVHQV